MQYGEQRVRRRNKKQALSKFWIMVQTDSRLVTAPPCLRDSLRQCLLIRAAQNRRTYYVSYSISEYEAQWIKTVYRKGQSQVQVINHEFKIRYLVYPSRSLPLTNDVLCHAARVARSIRPRLDAACGLMHVIARSRIGGRMWALLCKITSLCLQFTEHDLRNA